jgi:hypothetical protein
MGLFKKSESDDQSGTPKNVREAINKNERQRRTQFKVYKSTQKANKQDGKGTR